MEIKEYKPGSRLVLLHSENEKVDTVSLRWLGFIIAGGALLGIYCVAFAGLGGKEWGSIAGIFTAVLIVGLILVFVKPTPCLLVLEADALSGVLRVAAQSGKKHFIKEWPIGKIAELAISCEKRSDGDTGDLPLELSLLTEGEKSPFSGSCKIKNVDKREEMMDIGRCLARMLGMACGNIERNDPLHCALRFFRQEPSARPANYIDVQAPQNVDSEDALARRYAQDEVEPDKRLEQIICEEFSPDKHKLQGKVVEYAPGKRLLVDHTRPRSEVLMYALIGMICGLALIALLSMFVLPFLTGKALSHAKDYIFVYMAAIVGGCVMLGLLEFVRRLARGEYNSHHFDFHLAGKALTILHNMDSNTFDLSKAKEIVLRRSRCLHTETTGSGKNRRTRTYYTYNTQTILVGVSESDLMVGETGEMREQDKKSYMDGLSFAGIFTRILQIPLRFEDKK